MKQWIAKACMAKSSYLLALLVLVGCGSGDSAQQPTPDVTAAVVETVTLSDAPTVVESGAELAVTLTTDKAVGKARTVTIVWRDQNGETRKQSKVSLNVGQRSHHFSLGTAFTDTERFDHVAAVQLVVQQAGHADAVSASFDWYATAPAALLFNSNGFQWQNAEQAKVLIEQGAFQAPRTTFEPWALPTQPTWQEDPYSNNTWLLYYHSLGWLYAYDFEFERSGDKAVLEQLEHYLFDYASKVQRGGSNNYMAWNDHAVAWRMEALSYFYQKYGHARWSNAQLQQMQGYLRDHADELVDLLHDPRYFAHNHSMYHALALYNFSFIAPYESALRGYREEALVRMNELFEEMVNTTSGVSVEQSTTYHFIAMELFIQANQLAHTMTAEPLQELAENLSEMVAFAAHLIYRNGGATALGDTDYQRTIWTERLLRIVEEGAISSAYARHLATQGAEGTPLLANYVADSDGYVIQRPGYAYSRNEVFTFTDFGKKLFSHGHHDAGNVIATDNGDALLIDAGGPYLYNSPKRAYYRSAYAHNTLIVDEQSTFANDAKVLDAACHEEMCYSLGRIDEASYQHWRLVVTQRDGDTPRWSVIDIAMSKAGTSQDYKLVYHFPMDADVTPVAASAQCQTITLASDKAYCVQVAANTALTVTKWQGVDDDNYTQGWVQPGFGKRLPAPVLEFTGTDQQLLAVTELRTAAQANQPMATVQAVNAAAMTYTVELGRYTLLLSDLASAAPAVHVSTHN
ncbi:hypothetical protein CWI80_04215 [Pseudidiomarina sediminum]|uniref:Heparinase II/III-like C-terminal domain-containing protein n=1 Tax=Pseudidiomarina sediminum TaxID=431675 RepID=A0A432ZB00_9GAMM|nr:heparinase II/III family protein [Pseudidiomarina sediminum]RUO74552.1 hypothetical protein CWI80_04215 [Pseudidiomarina sediminum]